MLVKKTRRLNTKKTLEEVSEEYAQAASTDEEELPCDRRTPVEPIVIIKEGRPLRINNRIIYSDSEADENELQKTPSPPVDANNNLPGSLSDSRSRSQSRSPLVDVTQHLSPASLSEDLDFENNASQGPASGGYERSWLGSPAHQQPLSIPNSLHESNEDLNEILDAVPEVPRKALCAIFDSMQDRIEQLQVNQSTREKKRRRKRNRTTECTYS